MGVGLLIVDSHGNVIYRLSYAKPWGTNNQAEYLAAMEQLASTEHFACSYKWQLSRVPHHSFYNFF
jgi:ribonuclease HI